MLKAIETVPVTSTGISGVKAKINTAGLFQLYNKLQELQKIEETYREKKVITSEVAAAQIHSYINLINLLLMGTGLDALSENIFTDEYLLKCQPTAEENLANARCGERF